MRRFEAVMKRLRIDEGLLLTDMELTFKVKDDITMGISDSSNKLSI